MQLQKSFMFVFLIKGMLQSCLSPTDTQKPQAGVITLACGQKTYAEAHCLTPGDGVSGSRGPFAYLSLLPGLRLSGRLFLALSTSALLYAFSSASFRLKPAPVQVPDHQHLLNIMGMHKNRA